MATLDYIEMVALSEMYARWAIDEQNISPEQRTKLVQWSSDYEAIADHCGAAWIAKGPISDDDPIVFIARAEVRARGWHGSR